jgi:hypothetical protein
MFSPARDAHACRAGNLLIPGTFSRSRNPYRRAAEICPILSPPNRQCLAKLRRTVAEVSRRCPSPVPPHDLQPRHRLQCPDQHRVPDPLFSGDHVGTKVHAVREIHVQVTAHPEHHVIAPGPPAIGVTCRIAGAKVRLNLDNLPDENLVPEAPDEILPEQVTRNRCCVPKIERAGELHQTKGSTWWGRVWNL